MTVTPIQQINIEERRHQVVALKKIGMTDREIMAHLNAQGIKISHVQVNRDWHKVLDDWAVTRTHEIDGMKELQHARLESIIHAHWAKGTGWKLSKPDDPDELPPATDPDPRSAELILRAVKGIRELYGLDNAVGTAENPLTLNLPQPEEYDIDLSEMSPDELKRLNEIVGAIIEANDIATGNA
ncbi:hypothetical protein LCGC14_0353340 [marine sediment metagenome]|uniref:Uncharacterized protein n=1 Tax=marine sediment metagenome TaxID=412755 RepID=A0A0F9TT24_9ZZZZ